MPDPILPSQLRDQYLHEAALFEEKRGRLYTGIGAIDQRKIAALIEYIAHLETELKIKDIKND